MKCAVYCRVSVDEDARPDLNSLTMQEAVCRSYIDAQRERGWGVTEVYHDSGFSGRDLSRPEMQRLLRDVRHGHVDVVVSYKLDRISRSLKDFYTFWETLDDAGIMYVSATQSIDTSSPAGSLMLNVLMSFAQYERELTIERTAARMLARARAGRWNGGYVPYGYDYDPQAQVLTPSATESPVVKAIFEWAVEFGSLAHVCKQLEAQRQHTRCRTISSSSGEARQVGGKPFRLDIVKLLIRNPIYKGLISCQGEVFEGRHEALVSPDLWNDANVAIIAKPRVASAVGTAPKDEHVHLLKGLLRCGDCGSTMTPYPSGKKDKHGQPYLFYVCTSVIRNQTGSPCRVRRLPARRLEQAALRLLADTANSPQRITEALQKCSNNNVRELESLRLSLTDHSAQYVQLDGTLRRLLDCFWQDEPVPVAVGEEIRRVDALREEVRREIVGLEERIEELQGKVLDEAALGESLSVFGEGFEKLDQEEQKRLVQAVVGAVAVNILEPQGEGRIPEEQAGGLGIRTKRVLLNIRLKGKTPEQGCSGASQGDRVNQTVIGSDLEQIGSPRWTVFATG